MARSMGSKALVLLAMGIWCGVISVSAQNLEPGVRPGAQRPEPPKTLPPPIAEDLFEIPAVIDRPLDVDEGPTVKVDRIELVGVEDHPGNDIARADVEALVSAELAAHNGQLTIGQLQAVADKVSNYHRARGLVYATCIVPVQDVHSGVVKLELLIGRLGRVTVDGNKRYSEATLTRPFNHMLGQPIDQEKLESALIRLNGYPGLSVTGVIQPGGAVGEGDLVARVQQERPFEVTIGGDSFGRPETGRGRINGQAKINNPFGIGDRFTAFAQPSVAPFNQKYVSGAYAVPLWWAGYTAEVFYRYNDYDVDNELTETSGLEIAGRTTEGGLELAQRLLMGRIYNLTTYEGITRKEANTFQNDLEEFRDTLTVAHGRVEFDMVDRRFAGLNGARVEYRRGIADLFGAMGGSTTARVQPPTSRRGGSGRLATGEFDSVIGSIYRLQSLSPLHKSLNGHTLLFQVDGQWSNDLLAPLEQFALGGISSVRGYLSSHVLFDSGIFSRLEYQLPPPFIRNKPAMMGKTWGEFLQLGAFYDYAWGEVNDPNPFDPSQPASDALHSAGMWVQAHYNSAFRTRLTVAAPVHEGNSKRADLRGWFEISYTFE